MMLSKMENMQKQLSTIQLHWPATVIHVLSMQCVSAIGLQLLKPWDTLAMRSLIVAGQ
jgi:hypothetical protein